MKKEQEDELRKLFRNNTDCYADTRGIDRLGNPVDGDVIPAMTEDMFIKILKSKSKN